MLSYRWPEYLEICFAMQVEFFGIPRERAGMASVEIAAQNLGQLLTALAAQIPSLNDVISADQLHSSFVASLNGDRFISDPGTPLCESDCVLILSADAGG